VDATRIIPMQELTESVTICLFLRMKMFNTSRGWNFLKRKDQFECSGDGAQITTIRKEPKRTEELM